jgi:hypothetical protein
MNGVKILTDTNILIYLLEGNKAINEFLNDRVIYISFITELELMGYPFLSAEQGKIMKSMIDECIVVDVNPEIKKQTIVLRKKYKIKLPDAIIAAIAIYYELPMVGCDKDLKKIKELSLILIDI